MTETKEVYRAAFPHCDDLVLHRAANCIYCGDYPEKQKERIEKGINFTGESEQGLTQCPSEQRRPLEVINRWYGNVPRPMVYKGSKDTQ